MCAFQFNLSSTRTPRNLVTWTLSMLMSFILILISQFILQLVNTMYLVLLTFSDNLFISNHSFIILNSSLILWVRSITSFPVQKAFVSSLNNINCRISEIFAKSFMYKMNNFGPRIDPCSTPHCTDNKSDSVSSITTYCFLLRVSAAFSTFSLAWILI